MTFSQDAYPLWHGAYPMGPFVRNLEGEGRFMVRGQGSWVQDRDGRWYLDARSTSWHGTLGHGHPRVLAAIRLQAERLALGGTVFHDRPPQVTAGFAAALAGRLPEDLRRIRLGGSGGQMVEAAVLLSRFHRQATGLPERTAVITLAGGHHGMTAGTLPLSDVLAAPRAHCGPLPGDVHRADPGCGWTRAVAAVIDRLGEDRVTAVLIEPVMGVTGTVPDPADLRALTELCRSSGVHLIADEVNTGCGRAGAMSRMCQLGIVPDMLVLGPGLTAGYLPAAALAVSEDIYRDLADLPSGLGLPHGSTTDGNPLVSAAGLAVLEVLYETGVLDSVPRLERLLHEELTLIRDEFVPCGDVDGAGLLQRIALRTRDGDGWLAPEVTVLRDACEEHGLIASSTGSCLFVVPPLTIDEADIREIGARLGRAFHQQRRAGAVPL